MRRFVLTSLGLGVLAALGVSALYYFQIFELPTRWLLSFFEAHGFFPVGVEVERIAWAEITVIVLAAIWTSWCLADLGQTAQRLIVFFIFAILIFAISPSLALYGKFFEPFSSLSALICGATAGFLFSGSELAKRRRSLESVLGRRISQNTFHDLMNAPKAPQFDGKMRETTVLTCQMFNREELVEKVKPEDLLRISNLFQRLVSTFLASQGAYIDESGPGVVRGFFGIIRDEKNHAEKAARAALDLRACLKALNQESQNRWYCELDVGVGLSSGSVVTGIYGSKEHFFLSGTGPDIDLSRRIAQVNLTYGSDVLISPKTYHLIEDLVEVRPMEMFYDPAAGTITELYQLLGLKASFDDDSRMLRDLFWNGLIHFREGAYGKALDCFSKARIPGREDKALEYFFAKTQAKIKGTDRESENVTSELTDTGHSRLLGQL